MVKKIILILSIILITGCTKNSNIKTIIEENDNYTLSINYPITPSKKLNKIIKKDIKKKYQNFKKNCCETKQSFNIDFKYNLINNKYINILLEENNNIKSYIFDIKKNKLLNIYDIFTKNDLDILIDKIKQHLKNQNISNDIINDITSNIKTIEFIFDDENFYFYFNLNTIITQIVPLSTFDLDITIQKETKEQKIYTYKEINKIIDPKQKIVALTFDDGPSQYTKQIIDLLNKYNANATFFILGNKVTIYNDTLKYLLDSGNEIGNHSYNHKWLTHVSNDELINQIESTQNIIQQNLNYTPTLFRPTYGSVNETIRKNTNLDIILWNVDTLDWKYKNGNKIATNALNKIKDESIVLMHDTHNYTYNALKIMLPKLKEQGFQFVTISELKEVQKLRNAK